MILRAGDAALPFDRDTLREIGFVFVDEPCVDLKCSEKTLHTIHSFITRKKRVAMSVTELYDLIRTCDYYNFGTVLSYALSEYKKLFSTQSPDPEEHCCDRDTWVFPISGTCSQCDEKEVELCGVCGFACDQCVQMCVECNACSDCCGSTICRSCYKCKSCTSSNYCAWCELGSCCGDTCSKCNACLGCTDECLCGLCSDCCVPCNPHKPKRWQQFLPDTFTADHVVALRKCAWTESTMHVLHNAKESVIKRNVDILHEERVLPLTCTIDVLLPEAQLRERIATIKHALYPSGQHGVAEVPDGARKRQREIPV